MNIIKKTSLLLSFIMALTSANNVLAEKNVTMDINENVVTRRVNREMFGVNCEWSAQKNYDFFLYDENDNMTINPQVKDVWGDTLVFARQAGCSSQELLWKKAIGPIKNRENQKMWSYMNDKVYMGPVEWLNALYTATPDAEIIFTFNMVTDTIENAVDMVEFLISDGSINYNGGTNWGEVRKSLGIEEPVKVWAWEFGNELDWAESPRWTTDRYIEYCKKLIPLVKAIDPDAKIMCHADTTAHSNGDGAHGDGWETWHREVLRALGDQMDYLAFHYYYPAGYIRRADVVIDRMEKDIVEITGSDRIKIAVTEHTAAPNSYTYDKENPYDYCLPHTIWGATAIAEFYHRIMLRDSIVASTCHSVDSSVWSIAYPDDDYNLHRTAVGEMMNCFARFGVGDALEFKLDTFSINESSNIAASAVKADNGDLNIIFTNRYEKEPVTVDFKFKNGDYRIKSVKRIHGDVKSADNWYRIGEQWEYNNPNRVDVSENIITNTTPLTAYTFDPLSIYALSLEKIEPSIGG